MNFCTKLRTNVILFLTQCPRSRARPPLARGAAKCTQPAEWLALSYCLLVCGRPIGSRLQSDNSSRLTNVVNHKCARKLSAAPWLSPFSCYHYYYSSLLLVTVKSHNCLFARRSVCARFCFVSRVAQSQTLTVSVAWLGKQPLARQSKELRAAAVESPPLCDLI